MTTFGSSSTLVLIGRCPTSKTVTAVKCLKSDVVIRHTGANKVYVYSRERFENAKKAAAAAAAATNALALADRIR